MREGLVLGRVHVLGRSWGGMLALEHALAHPDAVSSLILSNTGASTAEIVESMDALRRQTGADAYATMQAAEANGDYDDGAYREIVAGLLARHYRRIAPFDLEQGRAAIKELSLIHISEPTRPY